ncbi:MAG: RsmE family RNA methyltransferase, partial [Candidatus Omnitrophica bacterium]|nr:RsmE family RNA methyltransferase [Candidatus Omnitrophota bacterium]
CGGKFTPVSLRAACGGLQPRSAVIFIGPEGDFTVDEVGLAVEGGFIPVSLGDSVLRAETAAVAAAAFIKLYFQDEKR